MQKRKYVLFVTLLSFVFGSAILLLLPALACADNQLQEMKYAYSEGYGLYQRGSYKKAIAYFTQAYKLSPKEERYQRFRSSMAFFLATCYDHIKQRKTARRWLRLYRESNAADPRFRKDAEALWKRIRPRALVRPTPRDPNEGKTQPKAPQLEDIGKERLFSVPPAKTIDDSPSINELQRRLKNPKNYDTTPPTPPLQIVAYVFLGAGGLALLVGGSVHIAAANQDGQARALFAQGPQASVQASEISSRLQNAQSLEVASFVTYGVALLLAGTGAALLFLVPKPAKKTPAPIPRSLTGKTTSVFLVL